MASPRHVLIVEDEHTLRLSMVRGLAKLPGVDVRGVASVREAKHYLAHTVPALVLSDLDLPDGSGIEVVAELERLNIRVPVVFVSAFLGRFRSRLPSHGNLEMYEKPIPLETLRSIVESKLALDDDMVPSPFSVADFVQLAGMGRHSVVIDVRSKSGRGTVTVRNGELWSAQDLHGEGIEAFRRIAFWTKAQVTCRTLRAVEMAPRSLEGSTESILLDAARVTDEKIHTGEWGPIDEDWSDVEPGTNSQAAVATPAADAPVAAPSVGRTPATAVPVHHERAFAEAFERGVDALLRKDYHTALQAFTEADLIAPGERRVQANLQRLQAMGIV